MNSKQRKWAITSAIVVFAIIIGFINSPVVFIQSHQRGLLFTMGAISDKVLQPGVNFRMPILQKIEKIDIRPIQIDIEIPVGPAGAITKDNQTIGAKTQTFYVYKQDELVRMWKDFGDQKITSLIKSNTEESFKAIVGEYTIFEVPINQDVIRKKAFTIAKSKMVNYPVDVTELRIINYDWSDAFDKQIAETMAKAQQVRQKEQELKMAEFEAQKKVKQAEAQKDSTIAIAQGSKESVKLAAEAKVLEGEGIRKFNESIKASQDIEIKLRELEIEKLRVTKWNGQYVPTNNYGPIPLETGALKGK